MGSGELAGCVSRALVAGVALVSAGLLGGCSFTMWADKAPAPIAPDALEHEVATQLQKTVGQAPKSVDCPDPLGAKAGESTRCTLVTPDGTTFGVSVAVTRMDGSKAKLDIQVDQRPQ